MRKRSDSNKCFLCESEATATNVFCASSEATATNVICAEAKRQQQMLSVRKRSDSNNNNYAKAKMIKSIRTSPLVRMRYMKITYGYPYIHTFGGIYNGNS
ncbi:hypothetical protein [Lysinibacillus sp. JNUCC 51]|uniref:hypothetical protein n=1 Tax=Lysinibacillus sp. JNUCC-51 TaxID=2792479 RepID=UPI0019389A71|nr:hypothetical protein JNUCC51_09100 [Lysinibacillus sp. JNUCC-51]